MLERESWDQVSLIRYFLTVSGFVGLILGSAFSTASPLLILSEPTYQVAQADDARDIEVTIEERQVVSPQNNIRAVEGETLAIHWLSDEGVELHLHGYDIEIQLRPSRPAIMKIEASVAGRFPIMSHGWAGGGQDHQALIYLEVYPQ